MKFSEAELKAAKMGDFQELAWLLKFELISNLTKSQYGSFLADFFFFAEINQLGIAGQLDDFMVVSFANRKNVSTGERRLMIEWLETRPEVRCINSTDFGDELSDAHLEIILLDERADYSNYFYKFFNS